MKNPHILILGSGFGAVSAVRHLRATGCPVDISLLAPEPELFYFPSLIWIPAGLRKEADLHVDLRGFLEKNQVDYHPGKVASLDAGNRQIATEDGKVLTYDFLVIATGSRFIRKLPGIEKAFIPCEGYAPVAAFSQRLQEMEKGTIALGFSGNPNEPSAMRGGPMFEFVFGLDTLLRKQGRRGDIDLVFFSPAARPGQRLGEKAVEALLDEMRRRDIHTHLGHKLTCIDDQGVKTEGGDIKADLVLFMPGVTGPAWLQNSGLELSPGGFLAADAQCRSLGQKQVYVVGDSGSFPGPDWLPKQGHLAELQGETAAENIVATVRGKKAEHTFRPELICIVDTLDSGMLVYRSTSRATLLGGKPFHWAKRIFERRYIGQLS